MAEHISDIDGNDENDNLKKSRHQRARRTISSSSENSDDTYNITDTCNNKTDKSKTCVNDFPKVPNDLKSKMVCEIKKPLIKSVKTIANIQYGKKNNPSTSLRNKSIHYLQEHRRSNTKNSDTISASTSDSCSVVKGSDTYSVKESETCSGNEIDLGKHNLLLILNFCKSYILFKF